jgi:hypothetical protein
MDIYFHPEFTDYTDLNDRVEPGQYHNAVTFKSVPQRGSVWVGRDAMHA